MEAVAALSEVAENLRESEGRRLSKEQFEDALRKYLSGSHAEQQILQLWDKICGGRQTVGQGELCSFLLREMQQRESQARAHLTLPLSHQPSFSSMPNTKETVCAVLSLSSPPQYLTVCKDGNMSVWSTRFQLQQAVSVGGGQATVRGRQGPGMCVTSSVMIAGTTTLVLATTARELLFYDTVTFSCLHKFQKLPCVPLCLAYGSENGKEASSPVHLVWGDEGGCVGVLSFSQPDKSFFHSRNITFSGLGDQGQLVKLRYGQAHSDWVCQVGWTGPAHYIISAAQSPSPSLLIQHVSAHRKQYIFTLRMGVSCFAYSHSLEVVATGSLDHTVRLWTPFSPQQPVACLFNHTTGVVGVSISEQSQHLFSLARDLSLCVWDIREHTMLQSVSVKFPFTQRQPDFGPSPLLLLPLPSPTITISCNEYMARFTLSKNSGSEGEGVDTGHTHPVCGLVFLPHLDQLVSGCEGGEVRVWDVSSRKCCTRLQDCHRDQELTALAVDTEGGRIITGSRHGDVKVWDSLTGQNLQSLGTPGATEVVSILHNPERRRFLATGWNRQISVFEDKELGLSPGSEAWSGGTPHCDDIITMDYCPPNYLATGSFDGLTVVWNTDTERVIAQFRSLTKTKHPILTRRRSSGQQSGHSPLSTHPLSTPSRPASRRLSSYRLKSASSSHLHHAPVDKLLFIETRVKSRMRGQGTLITSEGGCAFFWDMFSSGPPLGWFPMTDQEGEVAMAVALDEDCHRILAGDTAGSLSIFSIQHFCTGQQQEKEGVKAEKSWQGHSSEVLGVVWVGSGLLVSASADHSVKMWTTDCQCVGVFGNTPLTWNSADSHHLSNDTVSTGEGEGTEGSNVEMEQKGRVLVDHTIADSQSDLSEEKMLGRDYQETVRRRMAERLQRRTNFSAVDTTAISRVPTQFSPFQALQVLDLGDKAPESIRNPLIS